jgi:hypothetical protein
VKHSTLTFANCCRNCGLGLLTDDDGDCYCLDCTRYVPAAPEPFVALVGVELVESADTLDELLATLAEILDDKGSEDVAVWQGPRVVMILHADGRVSDFGGNR